MALRKPLFMASEGYSEEMAATDTVAFGGISLSGVIDMNSHQINELSDPSLPQDAATKAYVDAVASGLSIKNPALVMLQAESDGRSDAVAVATSDLGDPTGLDLTPTPDDVVLVDTSRVLLTGQSPASENGLWVAHAAGWTRATDLAAGSHAAHQFFHIAAGGTSYGNSYWIVTTAGPTDVVGTDSLAISRTLYGLGTTVDGIAIDTDSMRVLVVDPGDTLLKSGLWLAHATAWTRPTDYAAGSHSGHTFCFIETGTEWADTGWVAITNPPSDVIDTNAIEWVQFSAAGVIEAGSGLTKTGNVISVKKGDGIEITSNDAAVNVDLATNPGLALSGTSPNKKLTALIAANQGLQIDGANGLALDLDGTTLQVGAGGVSVKGVPNLFEVGGSATSQTPGTGQVTAANLNTLTAGSSSNADALHIHSVVAAPSAQCVENALAVAEAIAKADPVYQSTTNDRVGKADASNDAKSRVIGVARLAQATIGNTAPIVSAGPVSTVLTSATAGDAYYLQTGGGMSTSIPGAGLRVVQVGIAKNATDLFVRIVDFGKKAA